MKMRRWQKIIIMIESSVELSEVGEDAGSLLDGERLREQYLGVKTHDGGRYSGATTMISNW